MKAVVQTNYGSPDVLKIKVVDRPALREDHVLVRMYATSVNAGDYFSMKGSPWLARLAVGFPRPKDYILGWDVAGRVEAVGAQVTQFRPGDEVFGLSSHTFAEYVAAPAKNLAAKPANLTFEQAATVPSAGLTALQGLRDAGKLRAGDRVLVNGAAGGVGTFAVQIAKAMGAEVTAVCSTRNMEMMQAIGADHVIDYTRQDFTQNRQRYDLILDNVGNRAFSDLRRALTPRGKIVPNSGHGGMSYVLKAYLLSPFMRQQGSPFLAKASQPDLIMLKDFIEAGKITPVIDREYQFDDIPQAMGYAAEGHVRGKVVISVYSA